MNAKMTVVLCAALEFAGAGCSSNKDVPLLFGSSNVVGFSVGSSPADQSADFTLGYKSHEFALVPITSRQPDGNELRIGSDQRGSADAFSVLGQFDASADRSAGKTHASLGKFFATGLAARKLAGGFVRKLSGSSTASNCGPQKVEAGKAQDGAQTQTRGSDSQGAAENKRIDDLENTYKLLADAHARLQKSQDQLRDSQTALVDRQRSLEQAQARSGGERGAPAPAGEAGRGELMFFAQYESLGFTVSAGAGQQLGDFTLGWKDRNLAIVPVTIRDHRGYADMLRGSSDDFLDSYSVLGQFSFDARQDTAVVDAGLGRFFATGLAASRLSDGFVVRLCDEHVPVAVPPKPPAQAPANAASGQNQ